MTGCTDDDQPLSYKYSYYSSVELFREDIINGTTMSQNLITDYSLSDAMTTILPHGTLFKYNETLGHDASWSGLDGKQCLMVMVSVSDSLGGVANITKLLEVKTNPAYTVSNYVTQWDNFKTNLD